MATVVTGIGHRILHEFLFLSMNDIRITDIPATVLLNLEQNYIYFCLLSLQAIAVL